MKRLGSILAVLVLVAGVGVVWQAQSLAGAGGSTDSPANAPAVKAPCCKGKTADDCPKATGEKAVCAKAEGKNCPKEVKGCESAATCTKARSSGCPFAAASTRPAVATADEKSSGCGERVRLVADTGNAQTPSCSKKADAPHCCKKDGKTACGKPCEEACCKKGECPRASGNTAGCQKTSAEAAGASHCGKAVSSTRPSAVAAKSGCPVQARLAAGTIEAKPSCCSKSRASVASATQPAAMPAGQSRSCSKTPADLASASGEPAGDSPAARAQ